MIKLHDTGVFLANGAPDSAACRWVHPRSRRRRRSSVPVSWSCISSHLSHRIPEIPLERKQRSVESMSSAKCPRTASPGSVFLATPPNLQEAGLFPAK